MANAWVAALAALLCLAACRTVERTPVEIETPVAARHFIVMRDAERGLGPGGEPRARVGATGAGYDGVRRTN